MHICIRGCVYSFKNLSLHVCIYAMSSDTKGFSLPQACWAIS